MSGSSGEFWLFNSWASGASELSGTAYNGPVSGLVSQFVAESPTGTGSSGAITPNSPEPGTTTSTLEVTAVTPDVFILAGSGYDDCAINTASGGGNNVLDAEAGSDFLTGGSGNNTFFLDARSLSTSQWDTISDPHAGDSITLWGVTPQDFALSWANGQGASGYTGLTGHFTSNSSPEASLTMTGLTTADLTDGKLSISYGRTQDLPGLPGSLYMHISING